jgi:outer membrane protein TolC
MLSVGVRLDLPLFAARRQDPVIASKRAVIDEIESEREAARREHLVALRSALAIWEAAQKRVDHYQRVLLPLASDRAQAALAAYRGGRSDLSASLAAMSDQIEQELAAIDRSAELARAWVALRYAFVREE